jgi:PAS domain S-box-containing protein
MQTDQTENFSPLRVLILENEQQDAELMLLELQRFGFDVEYTLAMNEAEFMDALQHDYDVILADYSLPQYNADEALELLRARNLDIPVIIVTGSVGEETAVACMKRGAADYLLKDRLGRLGQAVKHAIHEHQLEREREQTRLELQIKDRAIASALTPFALAALDGKITYVNQAFLDLWGYRNAEEVIGKTAGSLLVGVDNKSVHQTLLASGRWRGEVQIRHTAEETRYIDLSASTVPDEAGHPICLMASCVDITEHKLADEALRQSEARIRTIIDTAVDGIIISDAEGIIEMANPAVTQMFGYTLDELLGKNVTLLMNDHSQERHQAHIHDYLRTGESQVIGNGREVICRRKDGTEFSTDLAHNEFWLNGKRYFVGMLHDLTERKQVEEAHQTANLMRLEVEKANELRIMKSRFVSMITHQFKNPLAGIQLAASTLQNYFDRLLPEQRTEKFKTIFAQVQQMNSLLEDILTVGQMESGTFPFDAQPGDLKAYAESVVEDLKGTLGRHHNIIFESNVQQLPVAFDLKLMHRIFDNLLSNAVKYSPEGSEVVLQIIAQPQSVTINIIDQGMGIPPEDLAKIFEAFHRGENAKRIPGTGLGLAIVKQAVDLHGGSITCRNRPEGGTVFVITLPYLS